MTRATVGRGRGSMRRGQPVFFPLVAFHTHFSLSFLIPNTLGPKTPKPVSSGFAVGGQKGDK